ncbi:right-handed parallel beta-helix repeat-containing protein, partial [Candidatus Saccharibacteria bacterium]|nr:right-handed parallel beta-helix repeat-containing protein [Candidatus Saccharibacteria bacterium]
QALYLAGARYTRVVNNFIYDNPMFGLQFFPDSDNATVENNVFYNNAAGVTFSSGFGKQSENNILRNNIIGNSGGNYYGMGYKDSTSWGAADVNHWWGSGTGAGNQATGNCLFGRGIESNPDGYTVSNNTKVSDPMFINAGGKDFGLKAGSPCTGKGIQTSSSTNPTSTSPTPTPTSPTTTSPTPTTPTPTSPTPQSPTGSLNFKNFTPWTAYEGYDLKNDGKTITRNNTDTLLVKYNKGTWANGHYGGYCITRAAGSPQPKSITFTAEYNSWGGNSVYFYPGSSNNKKWVVGNTYGVTKKSTQTVTLGTETKYCFGNVVNFPSGAAFSSFDNDRFLKVTGYTFNY